jgi:hypothetical protein
LGMSTMNSNGDNQPQPSFIAPNDRRGVAERKIGSAIGAGDSSVGAGEPRISPGAAISRQIPPIDQTSSEIATSALANSRQIPPPDQTGAAKSRHFPPRNQDESAGWHSRGFGQASERNVHIVNGEKSHLARCRAHVHPKRWTCRQWPTWSALEVAKPNRLRAALNARVPPAEREQQRHDE